ELLLTGRAMSAAEGERWGFYNRLVEPAQLQDEAVAPGERLAEGPTFAHMMTKTMLNQGWGIRLETAVESEGQGQARCMQTADFGRAYRAFAAKAKPAFEGD